MPELPEVEVIRRGLLPHLINKVITGIFYNKKPLRSPVNISKMTREITQVKITDIQRRAKYILLRMENGATIVIHLGMTGNLGIFSENSPLTKHDHLQWSLSDGNQLRYNDIRRFGSIHVLTPSEVAVQEDVFFKTSGPEPFDKQFTGDYMYELAQGKQVSVKQFIMNSQIVVGIGNIYANESLFRAGINPGKKIAELTQPEWQKLAKTVRKVLHHAIDCGGSTISDFLNASQEHGYFQMNFTVYGKDGDPCPKCNAPILKSKIGGRATFHCKNCQS